MRRFLPLALVVVLLIGAVALGWSVRGDPARAASPPPASTTSSSAGTRPAQLPAARAHAVPARGDPPRAAAVLHRAQLRRAPVRPRHPHLDLRAREGRSRTSRRSAPSATSPRPATSGCCTRRRPLDPPNEPPRVRVGGPDCTQPYDMALLNVSAMSFGALSANALRALNARRAGRRLRPRHRRGRPDEVPPRGRRRRHLGDRQRLLRRAHEGRRLRPGRVPREGRARRTSSCVSLKLCQGAKPGIGGALPGAKVTQGDRRGARRAAGREVRQPAGAQGVLDAARARPLHRPHARAGRRQADRLQALRRRAPRVPGDLQGDGRGGRRRPTSSSSTAPRAAPARRRWSTRTTSARRSPRG